MSLPQIAGHELQDLIGGGSCGAVYRAVASGGHACAVKVFSSMAINRRALAATMRHIHHMPPHRGVLPVHAYSFDQSPYFAAMPLVGMMTKDGKGHRVWQTPTLESMCGKLSAEQAWRYVYEVADALAWLHKHGQAHANLRPVNVLIEDDPESATRITDAGQGWVGGLHHFELGDHWVHLCPDQLDDPDGIATSGMSWDVYSFGVLVFRLLTGMLPRGEEVWAEQQKAVAKKGRAGLASSIDGRRVLAAIREQPGVTWPSEAGSPWEERRRAIIDRCLDFDPAQRWKDMREVIREFEVLESDYLLDDARSRIELERQKQAGRVRNLQWIGGSLLAALSVATILFVITSFRAQKAEGIIDATIADHRVQLDERDHRIGLLTRERDQAEAERTRSDENLRHSQQAVDQFLTQLLQTPTGNAMEVEFSRKQLEEALDFVQRSLPALEGSPQPVPERVRAYGNIGRIYLRLHQTGPAAKFLQAARDQVSQLLEESADSPSAPLYHQWNGRYALLLANIRTQEGRDDEALALLKEATTHLEAGLERDKQNRLARFECGRAWLEYGVRCRAIGNHSEATTALGRVPLVLDARLIGADLLSEEKFAVARSKFERGLCERDEGRVQESVTALIEAVQEMGQLVMGSSPKNQDQALALAEAYTELAEIVGRHFSAEDAREAHNQGVPILLELNRLHPDWAEAKYLLARNYGAISSLERDAGRTSEALKKKQDAIELMNETVADHKDNARYAFQLVKLKGEYAEMMGDLGRSKEAVPIVKQAVESLESLLGKEAAARMTPERRAWEVQLAQLYGVLGHTSESANQRELARTSFKTAAAHWEKLAAMDAASEEIQQGLNWTKNRLHKLK